jgi:hypothetical protein
MDSCVECVMQIVESSEIVNCRGQLNAARACLVPRT